MAGLNVYESPSFGAGGGGGGGPFGQVYSGGASGAPQSAGVLSSDEISRAFLGGQSVEIPGVPPPYERKKLKKGKKVEVAIAVAGFAREKAKQIKAKLTQKESETKNEEKNLLDKQKHLRVLKSTKENLEDRYNILVQKKRSELVEHYRKIVTQLKLHPSIKKFDTDLYKRILITTNPLSVKQEKWKESREIGCFQIRVDFSESNYRNGIQILNITQRFQAYDSPTISDTHCCWGNMGFDIENEFSSQDLYELIIDLIDYIQSPNDGAGYLGKSGEKTGWEVFLEGAKPQPSKYSFSKYDQNQKTKKIPEMMEEILEFTPATTVEWRQVSGNGSVSPSTSVSPFASTTTSTADLPRPEMSPDDYELMAQFEEAGLIRRAAYYFMGLVREVPSHGVPIDTIEMRFAEEQYLIYVRWPRRRMEAVSITEPSNPTLDIEPYYDTERYFANERDFRPEIAAQLRDHSLLQFRVNNHSLTATEMELYREEERRRYAAIRAQDTLAAQNQYQTVANQYVSAVNATQQMASLRRLTNIAG